MVTVLAGILRLAGSTAIGEGEQGTLLSYIRTIGGDFGGKGAPIDEPICYLLFAAYHLRFAECRTVGGKCQS